MHILFYKAAYVMFDNLISRFAARADEVSGKAFASTQQAFAMAEPIIGPLREKEQFVKSVAVLIVEFVEILEQSPKLYQSVDGMFSERIGPLARVKDTAARIARL